MILNDFRESIENYNSELVQLLMNKVGKVRARGPGVVLAAIYMYFIIILQPL